MGTSCVLGTMWPTCSECRCSACRPGPWSSPWHRCHSSSLPWRKRHPLAPHHPCSKWCSATRSWNTQDYFKSCLNDWNTADMVKMLINQSINQSQNSKSGCTTTTNAYYNALWQTRHPLHCFLPNHYTHLFGLRGLMSTGLVGAGMSIGNMSTHISSLPWNKYKPHA